MRISDWSSDVCSSDLWYNNQSSLNDVQAVVDSDGVFRAVISARDPGVHNWLDTSGYPRGAIQGRWVATDDKPTPTIRKVQVDEVPSELPQDTRRVTPAQRVRMVRDGRAGALLAVERGVGEDGVSTSRLRGAPYQ